MRSTILICLFATILACGNDESKPSSPNDIPNDTADTASDPFDEDRDGGLDGGLDGGDENNMCEDGVPILAFIDAENDDSLYALAADFTVFTSEGEWILSENWNGCDSYLFLQDAPPQIGDGFDYEVWQRDEDVVTLFERLPKNTHIFFMGTSVNDSDREASLGALEGSVNAALADLDGDDREWWNEHVHYVTDQHRDLDGWLGDIMTYPAWGAGIDRFQRVRYMGSYSDPMRYDDSVGGWPYGPNLSMAAGEAIYYNFEAKRETEMIIADDTVITVFDVEEAIMNTQFAEVTLPSAEEMAGYDTMTFDLYLGCIGEGEFGTCPAWDYNVHLYLCDKDDDKVCDTEIGRWITTYHREGRWVHDVSALLPLLANGGTRRFKWFSSNDYILKLDFRLSNKGKSVRPVEIHPLYSGNNEFNLEYNDAFEELAIEVAADAAKVELAILITGHGMSQPGNCAEFCNTDHHFYVNGKDNLLDFAEPGQTYGCQDQISVGTVPNQYGTWWYGRGGWCPGKQVNLELIDITEQIIAGVDNAFDYEGFYRGAPYEGNSGCGIRLTSWVVVSK